MHRGLSRHADTSAPRDECGLAGRFQPHLVVAARQPQDPQAGAMTLLRMRAVGEDRGDQAIRLGGDGLRPVDDPGRRGAGNDRLPRERSSRNVQDALELPQKRYLIIYHRTTPGA